MILAYKKFSLLQRDEEDMVELVRNCSLEFKEYYIQMQAAKRSQAPLPSQVWGLLCLEIFLDTFMVIFLCEIMRRACCYAHYSM